MNITIEGLKKYLFKLFVLIDILFIIPLKTFSENRNNIIFTYYTTDDGLSQNMVDCILKDSRGFLWFGTWYGLNRFDGYNFLVYKNNPNDSNSLNNNFIHSLCEDNFGNIWIGTRKGLNLFLYNENKFINKFFDNQNRKFISINKKINCILIEDNILWLCTEKGIEVFKIINENGCLQSLNINILLKSLNSNINVITKDKNKNFWIGTDSGIFLFNPKYKRLTKFLVTNQYFINNILSSKILTIFESKNGNIWVGTEVYGLIIYDPKNNTFIWHTNDPSNINSLIHNTVESITQDINGNVIVGTLGGLSIYNENKNNFINYTSKSNDKHYLNNEFVNCVYADKEGNVWIGTERGGINKYSIYQKNFYSITNEPMNNNSLSAKTVNSIFIDDIYLWVGTAGGGLNRIDLKKWNFKHYTFSPYNSSTLSNNFVTSICKDYKGNYFIGTWGGGINILTTKNLEKGIFIRILNDPSNNNSLINNFVSTIIQDKEGNLLIGTLGGLCLYDYQRKSFVHIQAENKNIPQINEVGCLQFDKFNNLWIGTIHGLYLIEYQHYKKIKDQNPNVKYFKNEPNDKYSLSGNYVISMLLDSKGRMWFGTYGNGLNLLENYENTKVYKFVRFDESDGLSNNIVYGILEDDNGNLWLSTENGLSKFKPEQKVFKNYYKNDGLLSNHFYWSAAYKSSDGKMFFGNMEGLNFFHPDSIKDNQILPKVILTNLKILSTPVEVGKKYYGRIILRKNITETNKIVLSHKIKEFTIEFSALHYDQPENCKYLYYLKNYDETWNYTDSKHRFATYSNLEGGRYVFMVKASNNDGYWSKEPLKLEIVIIPPFYKTLWFKFIFLFSIMILIYLYIRIRLSTLTKQKIKLEELVRERTSKIEEQKLELQKLAENLIEVNKDLETKKLKIEEQRDRLIEMNKKIQSINQQRLQFFTRISHEFKTPLTLILAPVEQLLSDNKISYYSKQQLQLIKNNANRLLHLINQLMELRKIETGKIQLVTIKDDIIHFIKNIVESFKPLAKQKDIQLYFSSSKEKIITFFDCEKIENILYNLLSNAIKYTHNQGIVFINCDITSNVNPKNTEIQIVDNKKFLKDKNINEFIEITIADNGPGIPVEHMPNIFKLFYRVYSPSHEHVYGTGIGLALVKEMVKIHKGFLFVSSIVNKGTTFRILIPIGENYLLPEEKHDYNQYVGYATLKNNLNPDIYLLNNSTDSFLSQNTNNQKFENISYSNSDKPILMIIEDNIELRKYLANEFSDYFKIIEASNGKEGYELAKINIPDIIVTDILMPEMDGLELCEKLKNNLETSHIPIIILSSRSEISDQVEGLEIGADDYVTKPFNINVLKAKVVSIINNRNKLKEIFFNNLNFNENKITTNKLDESFILSAIKIVNENIASTDFNIEDFANKMNISRSMLHKKLVSLTGLSPIDFITTIKMKKALQLLTQSNLSVSEIAYKLGFNDPKYFSRCFKKHYGKTPSEYRE